MAARSQRFLAERPTAVGTYYSVAVPPGHRWLVSTVLLAKRGSGSAAFNWGVQIAGTDWTMGAVSLTGVGANQLTRPWIVLDPSDKVWVYQDTSSSLAALVSGIEVQI